MDNSVRNSSVKEKELKLKLKEKLGKYGLLWFPPKVRFYECDIFGVYDCLFFSADEVYFIQLTTLTNLSHRRKKIVSKFNQPYGDFILTKPPRNSQIYAWDEKNNNFKIENV